MDIDKESLLEKVKIILHTFLIKIKERTPENLFQKKYIIYAITGIIALSLFIFGINKIFFHKKKKTQTGDYIQVKVKKIDKINYTENYSVMGTIKGTIENELRFEIDGTLMSFNFKEGDRIKRGQVICSIDPKDAMTKADYAKSKYASEQSAYFSATQRLKVYEELFKMKALSESKLQEARYEIQSSEARMKAALSELELAQSNLSKTNLIALSDGLLAEILIKPGEYITPQDVVAKFISGEEANFEVDVPEKDINKLKLDLKVKVNCDAYPEKEFMGIVKEIAPTVKEKTRTTTVKIAVPNEEGLLRSGMFARGTIYLMELQNVILVPQDSVIILGDSTYLIPILKPDPNIPGEGIVEMRHVVAGTQVSDGYVIQDGLFPQELIIIETQGQLSDGLRVKYTEISDEAGKEKIPSQEQSSFEN